MTIEEFLQAPYNYQVGIQLLEKKDPGNAQLQLLKHRYSIINEKRLINTLKALVGRRKNTNALPTKPTTLPTKAYTPSLKNKGKKIEKALSEFEQTIKDLRIEKSKLLQEASNAHHELTGLYNQKSRLIRAQLIHANWKRIGEIWEILDYIEQYNRLPAYMEKADNFELGADLIKRRNSLRTYVSKYQKLIKSTPNKALKLKYDDKLRKYEFELKNIESQIR